MTPSQKKLLQLESMDAEPQFHHLPQIGAGKRQSEGQDFTARIIKFKGADESGLKEAGAPSFRIEDTQISVAQYENKKTFGKHTFRYGKQSMDGAHYVGMSQLNSKGPAMSAHKKLGSTNSAEELLVTGALGFKQSPKVPLKEMKKVEEASAERIMKIFSE